MLSSAFCTVKMVVISKKLIETHQQRNTEIFCFEYYWDGPSGTKLRSRYTLNSQAKRNNEEKFFPKNL